MNSKAFLTRIQMKRDTSSNWVVNNPVLLDGEVVIVDTDAGAVRYKVGDGTKKFTQLPFTDENMLNLVNNKQDRLTIDATPTSGSTNPVMSGGVVSYAVPQTRTINGKALSANISLTASDVGADASGAASTALNNAKTYTNQEIASVKSLVSTTYETQSSASTKLAEAKAYTDTAVADLADADHNHDDRYFTESKLNSVLGSYETKDDASDKLATAKSYTDTKVSGLVSSSTVDSKISTHNTASGAHSDIRALISDLNTKVTNFLDVDEETTDQLSEVLEMIEANKGTIESLTTSKVSVSDIANNLTTNSAGRVLSAAQGVYIQSLINGVDNDLETHATDTSNPHGVTKAQVGLSKVDNTADASKPVSAAQAIAIADAKSAGTQAQTNLTTHVNTKTNPHGVTCAQIGAVATSGDIMTGRLQFNMANPHIHMKDTGYSTDWYFQAYQDQLAFGPTFATAVKTDKNGNMTVPGMTNSTKFVSSQGLAVAQTDGVSGYGIALYSNATPQTYGLWFGKTSTYGTHGSVTSDWATYFGMNSGATTRGWVFRREDGCAASISGAGNLHLNGTATIGSHAKMTYDSTNECLNFAFV